MAEIIVSKFDVDELSPPALQLLKAAVTHAHAHVGPRRHLLPISAMCRLAGLGRLTHDEFSLLLKDACRAVVIVEAIDPTSSERDDLPYSSWPVFNSVMVDGSNVEFEVSNRTFDEKLLAILPTLTTRVRKRTRNIHLIGTLTRKSPPSSENWKVLVL